MKSATAFFHSTRFLDTDCFGKSKLGFMVIIVLILGWLSWGLLARINVYEATDTATVIDDTSVVAEFPPTALIYVQKSQIAEVRLHSFPWTEYGKLSAVVSDVSYQDGQVLVELQVDPKSVTKLPLKSGMTGTVLVFVDRVSPFRLFLQTVLRSATQLSDQ